MSTYLLAWAFGDFEYIEDFTRRKYNGKNLPVRVYTTRGLKEQGKLALESAHQVVDYFSEVSMHFARINNAPTNDPADLPHRIPSAQG
jgi:aminopeptidase N